MSKYVIELDEDVKILQSISVTPNGNAYTNTQWLANLKELNSDYINEHFGSLQDEAYQRGFDDAHRISVEEYRRGLNDAWEAARKIVCTPHEKGLGRKVLDTVFCDALDRSEIMFTYSAQEAIDKIKAYEDKQKEDDSIKIGDEVTHKSDSVVWKAVCIRIDVDGRHMNLMGYTGAVGYYPVDDFKKTGRHFDIGEILGALKNG